MKKVFLLLVAVVTLGFAANAQNAIGIRGGFGSSTSAELSYMQGLGGNRLELDLGLNFLNDGDNPFHLAGIYQWTGNITGNLGWYAGIGAVVKYCPNHGLGLAVAGQIGLEYDLKSIPFQITADFRPAWDFLSDANCGAGFGWGGALGIRYTF